MQETASDLKITASPLKDDVDASAYNIEIIPSIPGYAGTAPGVVDENGLLQNQVIELTVAECPVTSL